MSGTGRTLPPDCIFCAIAAGRAPAEVLCQDEQSLAFLDIHPAAAGHTLLIPRSHVYDIYELSDDAGAALMRLAVRVSRALREALQPDGLTLLQNSGRAAGQEVPHFHVHLIPRRYGDGLRILRGPPARSPESLAVVARRVRASLETR